MAPQIVWLQSPVHLSVLRLLIHFVHKSSIRRLLEERADRVDLEDKMVKMM